MSILATVYESGLAAVQVAAMQPPPGTLWSPEWAAAQEAAAATKPKAAPSPPVIATAPTPPARASTRSMSEAERLSAIEGLRLPGTDAAVDQAKADPTMTPTRAAPLIMAAYKAAIRAEFGSEAAFGSYRAATESGRVRIIAPGLPAIGAATSQSPINVAKLSDDARSEWRESASLQTEFSSAESYANYRVGVAQGRVRVNGRSPG